MWLATSDLSSTCLFFFSMCAFVTFASSAIERNYMPMHSHINEMFATNSECFFISKIKCTCVSRLYTASYASSFSSLRQHCVFLQLLFDLLSLTSTSMCIYWVSSFIRLNQMMWIAHTAEERMEQFIADGNVQSLVIFMSMTFLCFFNFKYHRLQLSMRISSISSLNL